jgi:hypothetical protein
VQVVVEAQRHAVVQEGAVQVAQSLFVVVVALERLLGVDEDWDQVKLSMWHLSPKMCSFLSALERKDSMRRRLLGI